MACIAAPATEALVVTAVALVLKAKEKRTVSLNANSNLNTEKETISLSRKLMWLSYLLWGGVFLLTFEHIWHGEIVPFFPFLTAAADPMSASVMVNEILTVGVSMCLLITAVWGVMLYVAGKIVNRPDVATA